MFGGKSKLEINNILALYPDPEGIMSTLLAPSRSSRQDLASTAPTTGTPKWTA